MQQKLEVGTLEWYKSIFNKILSQVENYQNQVDTYQLLIDLRNTLTFEDKEIRNYAMKVSKYAHEMAAYKAAETGSGKFDELYWMMLLFEAQNYQLDSGLLYLEKNRKPKERFYEPRRDVFTKHGIIDATQALLDDDLDVLAVSLPPGTGKSTYEDFLLSLVGGWYPNDFNLSSAHSSILTRSLYDGVLEIINDAVEYTWHEIFPNVKQQGTNAKETTINLERAGRFKTWTFRSIDGSLTGATRCNRLLTADDLVSGIEEALNKNRLETLWVKVVNDLFSRMLDGCKRILFATRWSVHDPIGKLQTLMAGNPRAKFIAVPALDENGESNFKFLVNGFSKEYFEQQKDFMDEISFNCLYQQKPAEREGLLFPPEKLRRFYLNQDQVPESQTVFNIMPEREPDAIWGACDTKDKGTDFESFPIAYQYGEDFYIPAVVFDDNTDYDALDSKTADLIIENNPHLARFESNQAGGRIADNISKMVSGLCRTIIDTKFTTANKETKILVNSDWIIKHCLFLEPSLYAPKTDYGLFMECLVTYTTKGKVLHDDAPDSLAILSEFYQEKTGKPQKTTRIIKSPY